MQKLGLEHMVAVRPVGPGNWSRDGNNVAFVWADRSGKSFLWVCPATGGQPRQLADWPVAVEMLEGTDRRDVWGGPQWCPVDDRILFHSSSSYRKGQASVWTVNLDGELREITRHVSDDRTARWSPNGQAIAFVGNRDGRDDLQIVAAIGGRALQLTYDRWDNTDIDWSPDGKWLTFISQRSDSDLFANSICVIPANGGDIVQLTSGDSHNDRSPKWAPDQKEIVFVSNRNDNDDIWCVDVGGGRLRVIAEGPGDKADPRWSPDGKWIAFTHYLNGAVNIFVAAATGTGVPRRLTAGGTNITPRWSPDGRQILYRRSGHDAPGDLWVKDIDSDESDPGKQLTCCDMGTLTDIGFSKPEIVGFPTTDGAQVEALLYRPVPPREQRGPAILWVHGGANLTHTDDWHPLLQYLAQRGYTILAPNYRGSTGYGKRFMEANIGPNIGCDLQDWIAAAAYLRSVDHVAPSRVAIMGRSAGGFATLFALGQTPDLFQAGVAIAAPSNWISYWEETQMSWTRRFRVKTMGQPAHNQETYHSRSPITYAERYRAPVLIVHGEADPGVPSGQAKEMAAELKRLGKVHECLIYPGEGHQFAGIEAISDSVHRIERFLEAHLAQNQTQTQHQEVAQGQG